MAIKWQTTLRQWPSSILDMSIAASVVWVRKLWERSVESPALHVVLTSNLDAERAIADMQGMSVAAGTVKPMTPWAAMVVATIAERTGAYAPWAMQFAGVDVGRGGANNRDAYFEHVRPVDVGIGIRFRCDSQDQALAFSSLWLRSLPSSCIDIINDTTKAVIRIGLVPESNLSIPPQMLGTPGNYIDVETTLIVKTYVGETRKSHTINKVNLRTYEPGAAVRVDDYEFSPMQEFDMPGNKKIVPIPAGGNPWAVFNNNEGP